MKIASIFFTKSVMKLCLPSKWWSFSTDTIAPVFVFVSLLSLAYGEEPQQASAHPVRYREAIITVTVMEPNKEQHSYKIQGTLGTKSQHNSVFGGIVVHAVSNKDKKSYYGCTKYEFPLPTSGPWISLVERGECNFVDKVQWAARANATAIVVYNNTTQKELEYMDHQQFPIVTAIITKEHGHSIINYLDKEKSKVRMDIVPGEEKGGPNPNTISKTSVLFVSISFIVLMIISLAWLGFYYIQRFRYSHAKERLARRLACAAKKAIAKIPQKTIKSGDKELEHDFDQCAVCIEPYKAHDVIRMLPCRHVFHKSCVDPWLLDQRSCPMCKLDILRAYGMQVGGSQESVRPDPESNHVPVRSIVPQEEPEASSSVEETQSDEIKVLLVPHTCLHFHPGREKTRPMDEASSGLRGSSASEAASRSFPCNSRGTGYNSRVQKCDEELAAGSCEMKSLLQPSVSDEPNQRWQGEKVSPDRMTPSDINVSCCEHQETEDLHSGAPKLVASPACSPTESDKTWEHGDDSSTCSCMTGDSDEDDHTVSIPIELPGYDPSRESAA